MQRGQTPAGTRRSICVAEMLAILAPQPGKTWLDATLFYGGHTQAVLPLLRLGEHLEGLDVDEVELSRTRESRRVTFPALWGVPSLIPGPPIRRPLGRGNSFAPASPEFAGFFVS